VEAAEKICIQHTNEKLTADQRPGTTDQRPFWGRWADADGDGDADGVDSRRLEVKR